MPKCLPNGVLGIFNMNANKITRLHFVLDLGHVKRGLDFQPGIKNNRIARECS